MTVGITIPNLARVGLCVLASLTAIGCGGSSAPVTDSGFYRHENEPTVYRYDKATESACGVVNVTQMALFGGFSIVHTVPAPTDIVHGKAAPNCLWPDGTYRAANATSVFRIQGQTACRLGKTQPKNIIVLPSNTDVLIGRTLIGTCGA